MASAPQAQLPLFYKDLMPLNSREHKGWKSRNFDDASFIASTHAIPLTVDEFVDAQRHLPIVFTSGDNPLPIALMGLNEGVNTFVGDDGKMIDPVYLPAYARRYPFLLARLSPESEELSLCFDPEAGVVGDSADGNALFTDDGNPSEFTSGILEFCQRFEEAGNKTKAFMDELEKHDLLMDGEIAITMADNPDKPFVYRGFRMVDENKLRELPAATVEELNKNGILTLLHAHLFSLGLMRVIFARQNQQGRGPQVPADQATN